jgi:hypothetical protein
MEVINGESEFVGLLNIDGENLSVAIFKTITGAAQKADRKGINPA